MHKSYNAKQIIKLIIILALPLLAYILAYILIKYNDSPICIWKNIFHRDCWGCGLTRAFESFCRLDFKQAMTYNNKIFIIVPILLYAWLKEIIKTWKSLK